MEKQQKIDRFIFSDQLQGCHREWRAQVAAHKRPPAGRLKQLASKGGRRGFSCGLWWCVAGGGVGVCGGWWCVGVWRVMVVKILFGTRKERAKLPLWNSPQIVTRQWLRAVGVGVEKFS